MRAILIVAGVLLAACTPRGTAVDAESADVTGVAHADTTDDTTTSPDSLEPDGTPEDGAPDEGPAPRALPRFEPLTPQPAQPACAVRPDAPPLLLSETGCYEGDSPAAGLVPYAVRSALWTDGAIKTRFLALPPGATVGATDTGEWDWPDGTVIIKTFALEYIAGDPDSQRPAETRVMVKVPGDWRFFTYRWREDASDADRLDDDIEVVFELQDDTGAHPLRYYFPDEDGCQHCHSGVSLGPRTAQLNMDVMYGQATGNQLEAMAAVGLFSAPIPKSSDLPRLPDPFDATASLEDRARSYLHGNCAHCHRPGGWQPPELTLDLRLETPLAEAEICGVPKQYNLAPGTGDLRLDPGHPDNSMILGRMLVEDLRRMPSIGTFMVDEEGTGVVRDWIASLVACPE